MPSINLAPGTQYIMTARKRRVRLYSIAAVIILIFASWGIGLYVYVRILTAKSDGIKTEITIANQKLSKLREESKRVELFENRLVSVSKILDSHISWEQVFAELERLLPLDTVLTSFSASSTSPTIVLGGITKNIDQVALAFTSLTKSNGHPTLFEGGTVNEIKLQNRNEVLPNDLYTFSMMLQFNTAALKKTTL